MTKAAIGIVTFVIVTCLGVPVLLLSASTDTGTAGCSFTSGLTEPSWELAEAGQWDTEQLTIATIIINRGAANGISTWGQTIALAVAMQESRLRNLPHLGPNNDHDSIGVFQQRPSQGWGIPEQLADPAYQADRFYAKLKTITGWETMPLTRAAQAVQISAYPNAYAKWTSEAVRLVEHVASAYGLAIPFDLEQCLSTCITITAADSGSCVDAATVFGRAQTWLTAWSGGSVPYLSSGNPADWFQGYRRDCSGYVSMALGLEGPGLSTSGLAERSTIISKSELRPGDILINTAPNLRGHVVLFERWADASMTRYYGYEQTGSADTQHRAIPYPYFGAYPMVPYRFGKRSR
ncbi:hypothetical protein Aca07nite_72340 [Actinoplanes capillaceus]|uniref:NlpC/P60 family protein n=1 Tax=Actinoplanes campanulatus TaxID=113559 RepID=A0ABQ3WUN1_9ACTN|nr:glycoside hydrolase [Actinoplanes capillaceus]GID49959.1 hypothetical protein Aca07nite_72340 [Actinoplanes capillaceus]